MESPSPFFEIILILILIFANGIFAMTEMSIVSSRKARLERKAEEGNRGAEVALELAEKPTQMLSTVQVGITLIGILTGAFGGANLSQMLSKNISSLFPSLVSYSSSISLFIVISIITYLSLIIGELVPKRLALNHPEPIAAAMARPMRAFSILCKPIVYFLSLSTNAVLRMMGTKPNEEAPVTEEEIKILLEQGAEAGTFEKEETELVDRVFRLTDLRAVNVMTPRTQVQWLDLEQSYDTILQVITESTHSRFPAAKGSLDNFSGILHINDILATHMRRQTVDLEKLIREPVYVPESMKIMKVLELLKSSVSHEAVVLDEYGGVAGFVTLRDIMEELVGHMPLGEEESDEPRIIQRSDYTWLVDGLISIDEFKDYFDLADLPGEDKELYLTVGGFITYFFGHIPVASDAFEWNGYRFEIVDMDRVRVDKVLITKKNMN